MSFEIMKRDLWQRREEVDPRFASLFRELAGAADEEEAMGIVIRHWSDFTREEQRELQRELVANTKGGSIFDKEAAREFFDAGYKAAAEKQPRVVYKDRVVEKKVYVETPRPISTPAEHVLSEKLHQTRLVLIGVGIVAAIIIITLILKR